MSNKKVSILIVDDHETTRRALSLLISSFLTVEHNCIAAASAEEALKLLESLPFHLVLVDIKLPGASGLELCASIGRRCPKTVIILVSGVSRLQDLKGQVESSCFDCVDKAANVQELKDSIQRALEFQSMLEANDYGIAANAAKEN